MFFLITGEDIKMIPYSHLLPKLILLKYEAIFFAMSEIRPTFYKYDKHNKAIVKKKPL